MKTSSKGLLDTSVIIDILEIPEAKLCDEPAISALTLAELALGPHTARDFQERANRQRKLQEAESAFEALPFDAVAAREYGILCAAAAAAGRGGHRRRALDFMIAATARANGLALYTRNPSDFDGLEGLLEIVGV